MKKMLLFSGIVLTMLISSTLLFAQTESKGDTLIIGPLNSAGEPLGALNEAIKADTTANGERVHKVYKLQRKVQYVLTETIQGDFPLVIVADKPDDENRPPIIRCGVKEDGSNVGLWWQLYDDAIFKNLWLSGINLDGSGAINWISQEANASGITITFDGCIVEFPYTWWAVFADWGGPNNYKITDCIFQYIGNPTGAEWNGAVFHHILTDTLIVQNTTFYDFGCFGVNLSETGGGHYYSVIDHCSFVNSMVHPVANHGIIKAKYTNNLFVNCHSFSDDVEEIKRHYDQEAKGIMNYAEIQWDPAVLDSLWGPGGLYGKSYDPNGDGELTVDELVWELKNNAWYFTQPIKDYWAQFADIIPTGTPWMNNYNKAMFENQDGPWTWDLWTFERDSNGVVIDSALVTVNHDPFKYFVEENTMNMDPGIVDMNGTDELLAQNCINMRIERGGGSDFTPVKWHGVDDYLAFTWPLDYDLSYTNAALENAGIDGKPIGSLQWWDQYEYTGIETRVASKPSDFELQQNYPNPFNPTTSINYSLNKKSHVELKVFNILGAEVRTLVNENKNAGKYDVSLDATDLSSGVYFYRLRAGDQTITRKMMLMK